MPAGSLIIGHEHKTEHFNIVLTGKAIVMIDGVVEHIEAPAIFKSSPGVRKVLYIVEDMRYATIHPAEKTDLVELEKDLIIKSNTFIQHKLREDAEKLRLYVDAKNNNAES